MNNIIRYFLVKNLGKDEQFPDEYIIGLEYPVEDIWDDAMFSLYETGALYPVLSYINAIPEHKDTELIYVRCGKFAIDPEKVATIVPVNLVLRAMLSCTVYMLTGKPGEEAAENDKEVMDEVLDAWAEDYAVAGGVKGAEDSAESPKDAENSENVEASGESKNPTDTE